MRLRIGDQRLIVHFDKAILGEHLSPMVHQPLVLPVIEDEIAPIRGEVEGRLEVCSEGSKERCRSDDAGNELRSR